MSDKGLAYALAATAAVFVYGGMTGRSPLLLVKAAIQGNKPASAPVGYAIASSASSTSPENAGTGTTTAPSAPSTVTGNVGIGKLLAAGYGWSTGSNWDSLYALWMRESGWRTDADNPSSGAYGIPQSLPASKMASAGSDYLTNPRTQIKWGLGYIKQRYGDPDNAWAHEESAGWY